MVKKAKKYKWADRKWRLSKFIQYASLAYMENEYIADKFFANKTVNNPLFTSENLDSGDKRALSGDSGTTKPDKKE